MYNNVKGFTLIELMITVAIIAILAAVAYPSYQGQIRKTHRSTAQVDLVRFSQALEKAFVTKFSYKGLAGTTTTPTDTGVPNAAIFPPQIPVDGSAQYYNVTISAADDTAFTVLATPIAGSVMAGDGLLTVASNGARCWYDGQTTTSGVCTDF